MQKKVDAVVVGGSLGGVLAAYSLCKNGNKVVLTESTDWIGGQLTSQAVPPDEHKYIEYTGCTNSYREYRNKVRRYYREMPETAEALKDRQFFCPGNSIVSRLAHPPALAHKILEEMLKPYSHLLEIMLNVTLVAVQTANGEIKSVTVKDNQDKNGESTTLCADIFLDGTDTGELLLMSGEKVSVGAESVFQTGEPHAPHEKDEQDMQPITWALAMEYDEKGDYVAEKPTEYEYFKKLKTPYDNYPLLSMYGPDSSTGKAKKFAMFPGEKDENGKSLFPLFNYRRIVYGGYYKNNIPCDVTTLNWPQNDYFMGNIFLTKDDEYNKYMAKQLTLSVLYYAQTEVPRADGGYGYRGLKPRGDITGTLDGLAKAPYIRESARLDTDFKITEPMLTKGNAENFADSLGVGLYSIDLHITTKSHTFFYEKGSPFEIPLRLFIAKRNKNLLPCCKNIGVTHITNGSFRLHPVEWNIGESAGLVAAFCLDEKTIPKCVSEDENLTKKLQEKIIASGITPHWDKNLLARIDSGEEIN